MKVLVTGGAGFVGSVLVPKLLELGHVVIVYDNLMYGVEPMLTNFSHENFALFRGDVRDENALATVCKEAEVIVHLAALVGYPICKKDENLAVTTNVGGTEMLMKVAPRDIPIIFASTGSCYGNIEGVCREDLLLKPLTVYSETKAMAERTVSARGNFIIYRFATGYGISPRMRLDLLINDFCYKAVRDKNLIVYEKHFKRTFIHVADMAKAFIWGIKNFNRMKNEVYNVGSEDMNLSKEQIAEFIRKKVKFYLHYADFGKDEDKRDYMVSYKKIQTTGYQAEVDLEAGVRQLIELFKVFELKSQYSNV